MSDVLSWVRLSGPFLIGHRGFPGAVRENTLPSFEAALEAGCDGIELDVRMTRDGLPVVHHDDAVKNAAGSRKIEELEWSEIRGKLFESREGSYSVHGLGEVLEAISGRGLLNVEVKPPGAGRHSQAADVLTGALDRVRPRESVLVSSFDGEILSALHQRDAALLLGFLFSSMRDLNHLEEAEAVDTIQAVHPRHDLVDQKLMKRAAERRLAVNTWTVDDPSEARRLVELGATAIITNRPDLVGPALM
jgi:glycerophosphoryl diester phosphodiesterase